MYAMMRPSGFRVTTRGFSNDIARRGNISINMLKLSVYRANDRKLLSTPRDIANHSLMYFHPGMCIKRRILNTDNQLRRSERVFSY
jgi:hypothetical protein